MDFVTLEYYIYFLPVVFLTIGLSLQKRNPQILILLIMSYLFFWLASGWHIILLLISTLVDWTAGKKIFKKYNQINQQFDPSNIEIKKSQLKKEKKKWLIISLCTNLTLLGIFKYLDFIIESLNFVTLKFSESIAIDSVGLLLPVGISFYTFQTMSYTIDIYRGKMKPFEKFTDFACYAAFFPQLVAGPIVRADHFRQQISQPLKIDPIKIKLGLTLIIYGIAKKMVIADNVAIHANIIFVEGIHLSNIGLIWWGTLCFGIQIYCDFSAYTDIALGSAILLGIKLPENFKTPYGATSPQDFWRRWHISLSTWLRDYLYIPLGGSKNGTKVMIGALMGTMLLGGLWHGSSWNFILWGFLHGILLLIHRFGKNLAPVKSFFDFTPRIAIICSWLITQIAVFFTWLVFRIEDNNILVPAMKTFVGINGYFDLKEMYDILPEIKALTGIIVVGFIILHGISGWIGGGKIWLSKRGPITWGVICAIMLTLTFYLRPAETIDFIYFRF